MKKRILFGGLTVVILTSLFTAGLAFAQTPSPRTPQTPYGPGGMMGRGRMGPGMMESGTYGPMHTAMQAALADELGLKVEELQAAYAAGKTAWQVAQEKGLTSEQFQQAVAAAREKAIAQMVADGLMTKEQADWMLNRMQGMWGQEGGSGGCPGLGNFGGRGGRWSKPANPPASNPSGINF